MHTDVTYFASGRQDAQNNRHGPYGQCAALHGFGAGVPRLRVEAEVLPENACAQVVRDVNEAAPDIARELARRMRKKVEMLFAHLKRILRLVRLRLRGPNGAQFEFTMAAIAQNLRRLAKLTARGLPEAAAASVA